MQLYNLALFLAAFSNLKKSEFFKDLAESKPETSVTAASNKINTVLVNPKQVILFYYYFL
jgi:hypothetical protein